MIFQFVDDCQNFSNHLFEHFRVLRLFVTYYLDEISTLKQGKIENVAANKFIHNKKRQKHLVSHLLAERLPNNNMPHAPLNVIQSCLIIKQEL